MLPYRDMDSNGNEEDGDEAEVKNGVYKNGDAASLHISKLYRSFVPRQLKQQPWRQQHKQHHCYQNRPPIFLPHPYNFPQISCFLFKPHVLLSD